MRASALHVRKGKPFALAFTGAISPLMLTDWRFTNGQFANLCLSTGGYDTIYLPPKQGAVSGFLKSADLKCNFKIAEQLRLSIGKCDLQTHYSIEKCDLMQKAT